MKSVIAVALATPAIAAAFVGAMLALVGGAWEHYFVASLGLGAVSMLFFAADGKRR